MEYHPYDNDRDWTDARCEARTQGELPAIKSKSEIKTLHLPAYSGNGNAPRITWRRRTGHEETQRDHLEIPHDEHDHPDWFTWYRLGNKIHLVLNRRKKPNMIQSDDLHNELSYQMKLVRQVYGDVHIGSIRMVLRVK